MELPSKILEQISIDTRAIIEDHMLVVTDKSTHEEHLFQSLQTNSKQLKIAITFWTGYNGIFIVTISKTKIYLAKSLLIKMVSSNYFCTKCLRNRIRKIEIKRVIIEEEHFTEANNPFTIKPNFSTLGSIKKIQTRTINWFWSRW